MLFPDFKNKTVRCSCSRPVSINIDSEPGIDMPSWKYKCHCGAIHSPDEIIEKYRLVLNGV